MKFDFRSAVLVSYTLHVNLSDKQRQVSFTYRSRFILVTDKRLTNYSLMVFSYSFIQVQYRIKQMNTLKYFQSIPSVTPSRDEMFSNPSRVTSGCPSAIRDY